MQTVAFFRKKYLLLLLLFLVAGGWLLFRSCSMATGLGPHYTFTIARDPSWYPLDLMGKESSLTGFTDELLLAIAKNQNFNLEIVQAAAGSLFDELVDGDVDGVVSTLSPTALTMQKFYFSQPYFLTGPVLVVRADSTVKSIEELGKKTLGVKRGSHIVFDISQYSASFVPYDSMTTAFDDLKKDRIDGVVMPLMPAYTFTQLFYPGSLKIATPPLSDEGLRIVAPRNREGKALTSHFNKGLEALKKEGTYETILRKWGVINPKAGQER